MIKFFSASILLLITNLNCIGQESLLMLQKRNNHKNAYYKAGEIISFRIKGDKSKNTGEIIAFEDSVIVLKGYKVHVNQIGSLYIDEKTKWWLRFKIEQILLLGGSAYLVVDVLNNQELSSETLIISGISIGGGLLAKWLIGNRIKIRGRTKLRILNFHENKIDHQLLTN